MGKITLVEVEKRLHNTYSEIENFKDKLFSRPDDFGHDSLHKLRSSLEKSEEGIVNFEQSRGMELIYIDPAIAKKILETILFITTKYSPAKDRSGEIRMAINMLINFQDTIRNVGLKERL